MAPPRAPSAARSVELQALLDVAMDAIILIDHRGIVEVFTPAAERLFGYQADEVLGHNVSMLMTERDRLSHDAYLQRYIETRIPHIIGVGREVYARRKDGTAFPAFLSVGCIQHTEPPRFVGFIRDITLRRQAIAAVQRERDRANRFLEAAQTVLVAFDAKGRVTLLNRKGGETLGMPEDALLGSDWLAAAVPAQEHALARAQLSEVIKGTPGQPHYCEYHVRTAHGEPRLLAWRCIAVRDAQGDITGVLCSGEDITESKRAEEESRRAQERMTHVSHLATMGEMAAGIAHELNQPLAAITTYAQASARLLEREHDTSDCAEVREALQQIAAQALRAGEIIRRLRSLVRNSPTQRELADINEVIGELRTLTQTDARMHDVRLTLEQTPRLPRISIDRIQIQQVILNLVRNAIEALDERGSEERRILIRTTASAEGDVEVAVHDNGPGVAPEILERMFDPFCTTKARGTGLGLAISRTIIEAHAGELGYRAHASAGATFFFRLPGATSSLES